MKITKLTGESTTTMRIFAVNRRPAQWLALIVRVALALPLIAYGLPGATGAILPAALGAIIADMFRFLAAGPGHWLALIGGSMLLVGLATRPVAMVLIMVATVSRHMLRPFWPLGIIDIAITMLFFLAAIGGGIASLDQMTARFRQRPPNKGDATD